MSKRVPGLKELLQAASLDAYIPTADSWCQQAGAVDLSEVLEIEESFADALCLRLLERRRLHKQAEKVVVGVRAAPQGLQDSEPDSEPSTSTFPQDEDFVPSTLRADATGSFYPLKSKKQLEPDRRMCGDNSSSAVTFGCSGSSQATSLSSYYTASRADAHLWPSLHEGTGLNDLKSSSSQVEEEKRQHIETRKKEAKWNFSGFSHQRVDDRFREHESFLQQQRLKAFKRRSEIEGDEQAERALNLERQARREDGERLHPEQLFVFDKPGFLQPRKRMALPSLQFTWAATWWGIRVNQVKDSFGLRADDFIVEVAGVPLSELEEDVCEQTFQRYSHEGVQVLVEPSCSRWGSLPHMNVNFDSMCADIEALQLDYGVSVDICRESEKLLLRGAQSAIPGAQNAIERLMSSYFAESSR
ncbi:unnamed protein product [Durusdinium trenchii]|uniref:PDZ domain-containing protein n=1 Tax=Durusdinium trenchii TaxID=1381693 RepID=A0ABP0R3H3_9DINO